MNRNQGLSILRPGKKLAEYTSIGIGGTCLAEVLVRESADLETLATLLHSERGRPFVLGGGSNLLATDKELDIILLKIAYQDFEILRDGDLPRIRVGAGMKLPVLLKKLQETSLSGLEALIGIPGTIGGAVAMNAGSWGTEIGDKILRVALWSPSSGLIWLEREQLNFSYRTFSPALPGKWIIWEIEIEVAQKESESIKESMKLYSKKKKNAQPIGERTAGCIFKNPDSDFAGKLLEQAGMKGKRIGDMEFSPMHANFMVNTGQGSFEQAMELLTLGKQAVMDQFGVELQTEVIILV